MVRIVLVSRPLGSKHYKKISSMFTLQCEDCREITLIYTTRAHTNQPAASPFVPLGEYEYSIEFGFKELINMVCQLTCRCHVCQLLDWIISSRLRDSGLGERSKDWQG